MSTLLQLPSYLEQLPVPTAYSVPPEPDWFGKQPTEHREPPRAAGLSQDRYKQVSKDRMPDVSMQGLNEFYVIEQHSKVAAFVEQNRLRGLLLEAQCPLNSAFGEAAIKRLSILRDDEGVETLFCLVVIWGEMDQARRALKFFDEQWWLARTEQALGKLNFDFELV